MAGERLLDNRYALLRVRGRGGMGVVWEARDEVLQRRVAVKEVDLSRGDPTARERVLREARVAARLKHSRLVDVYDIVEEGNRICLVQEFVDGPNLADVVAESGPLAPARAAAIGLELLDGLEA
ncbi:MAG: protein kinase domain-containing protein, partial [Acidimicrobiia bacterium]